MKYNDFIEKMSRTYSKFNNDSLKEQMDKLKEEKEALLVDLQKDQVNR